MIRPLPGVTVTPVDTMNQSHLSSVRSRLSALGLVAFVAVAFCITLAPTHAWAGDAEDQIAEFLDDASEDYDMLFFEDAVSSIQEGISVAEREGIRNSDVAELHLLLGLIRHADGDDDLAEDAFVDAFETDPDVEVDAAYRTPAVNELVDRAEARAEPPEPEPEPEPEPDDDPEPDVAEPPPEEDVDPLTHDSLRRADAGDDLTFEATIPADLPIFRVHVHHRRYGEEDFAQDEMEPVDATDFEFVLDGTDVRTSQIEYFITAIDRTGDVVAESGRMTDPHRISVIGEIEPDDEQPPADPDDPTTPDIREDPDNTGFYASLAAGTDVGFLPGGTAPTANHERSVRPGLAPAFAHTMLNLGWRITEDHNVAMYIRYQFLPGQDFDRIREQQDNPDHISRDAGFWEHRDECLGAGIPGDCMVGFKYEHIFSSGVPEIYSTVGLGFGRIRNWLELKQAHDADDPDSICSTHDREIFEDSEIGEYCNLRDTVRTGWMHFGVGGGMYFPIIDNLDLMADSYLMILVPDTSLNIDFNIGLRYRL